MPTKFCPQHYKIIDYSPSLSPFLYGYLSIYKETYNKRSSNKAILYKIKG